MTAAWKASWCAKCRKGQCEDCSRWVWGGIDTCHHPCAAPKDQVALFPVGEVTRPRDQPSTPHRE